MKVSAARCFAALVLGLLTLAWNPCGTAGSRSRLVLGGPPDRYWLISALIDASEGPLSPAAAQTCAALDPATCP